MIATTHAREGITEGRRRMVAAHDVLSVRRDVLIVRLRRALLRAMLDRDDGTGTMDDARASVEMPPGIDPVCCGPVARGLAVAGIIIADGSARTCRPVAHARPLTVWRLRDRDAALRWLADHPDPPDPDPPDDAGRSVVVTTAAPDRTLFD